VNVDTSEGHAFEKLSTILGPTLVPTRTTAHAVAHAHFDGF
jgi:hypothetical protein